MSIIDIHAHIWLGHEEENIKCLRRAAREYGIEKILISVLGSHHPDPEEITRLNDIAAKIREDNPLFGTYVTVSPEHSNALQVLEEGIQRGAVGMKIWVSCLCDEACCNVLYRRCAEADLPVLVHTFAKTVGQLPGESTAVQLRHAALAHPETTFIMAHLGGNCYHGMHPVQALTEGGFPLEKILFGSMSPLQCLHSNLLNLPENGKNNILSINPKTFLEVTNDRHK